MHRIDEALLRYFIPRLLERSCPELVRRSGPEAMKTNCFNLFIPKGKRPSKVLQRVSGTTVHVLEFDGNRHVVPATLEMGDIDPETIEVTHYYGMDEVRYEGIRHVALGLGTKWPYAWFHYLRLKNALGQHRFNSRPLTVGERPDILRDVVAATAHGTDAVDSLDLMSFRYGDRWADHPGWKEYQQRLDKQLAFLAESGELSTSDHFKYRPTGLGARVVDERKDASRKHGSNWWVQVVLGAVAVVGLVFLAAQAGVVKLPTMLDLTPKNASLVVPTPSVKP